ncbi:DUF4136 domain-containing protein [soil metagenome]
MNFRRCLFLLSMMGWVLFSSSCMVHNYRVASDHDLRHPYILDRYRAYAWASQVDDLENCEYFLNDHTVKTHVKHAISRQLGSIGYLYNHQEPDLLINFRVFDQPQKITRAADWGPTYFSEGEITSYDEDRMFEIPEGTVVVQFIDRKEGKIVWQGHVTGLAKKGDFAKEKGKIDLAISVIFKQYPFDEETLSYIGQVREMLLF